jgi:hypothetical protein
MVSKMIYRTLFSDTFINVEADSEAAACEIAAKLLRERIKPNDFIAWEDPAATPDNASEKP